MAMCVDEMARPDALRLFIKSRRFDPGLAAPLSDTTGIYSLDVLHNLCFSLSAGRDTFAIDLRRFVQGKPIERWGHKATGLRERCRSKDSGVADNVTCRPGISRPGF
jgi:hypothetical protein